MADSDDIWMRQALHLAQRAADLGEVPVGAIVVHDNTMIGSGHNAPISTNNPAGHAEIIALQQAAKHMQNYRLPNTTLYVTIEPCMMCLGAMTHARIKRLVFGSQEPKAGAVKSQLDYEALTFLNHRIEHLGGVLDTECSAIIKRFFKKKRQQN